MALNQSCKGDEKDVQNAAIALPPLLWPLHRDVRCCGPSLVTLLSSLNLSTIHKLLFESCCFHFCIKATSYSEFYEFHSLCPKKSDHGTLLKSDAIPQQSIHVYLISASSEVRVECCAMWVWITHRPLRMCYTVSASIHCGCCVNFKLPLLFYSLMHL